MSLFQKIIAAFAGVSILVLAIWIGSILFVALLIAAPLLMLYGQWRMKKMRKEFEKHAGRARDSMSGSVIDADYVVVEETVDPKNRPVDSGPDSRQ